MSTLQIRTGTVAGNIISLQNLPGSTAVFVERQLRHIEQVILPTHSKSTSGSPSRPPFPSPFPAPVFGTVTFTLFQPQGPKRLLK